LRIEFTVTEGQQYRALRAIQTRMASHRWALAFFLGVPALLLVTYLARGDSITDVLWEHGGVLLGAPALVVVGFPLIQRWTVHTQYRSGPTMRGRQVYDFREDSILMEGPFCTATMQWAAVITAVETREFFLLYTAKHRAHFVPKDAFATPTDLAVFRDLVRGRMGDRFMQARISRLESIRAA
jgi:hypothetical protein